MIHKQPVTWTHERIVACNGGGGPEGHPRVFINTDKPEIAVCGYCGLPFVRDVIVLLFDNTCLHSSGSRTSPYPPRIPSRDFLPSLIIDHERLNLKGRNIIYITRPALGLKNPNTMLFLQVNTGFCIYRANTTNEPTRHVFWSDLYLLCFRPNI